MLGLQRPITVQDLLRHTSFRRDQPGSVELWPLEPKTDVEPAEPWTAPKGQESAASPKARLATRIAKFIKREIDSGAAVWDKKQQRPARPGDFLILVRGRTGGPFDGILQALKRENIRVAGSHTGLGFNPLVLCIVAERLAQPEGQWQPFKPTARCPTARCRAGRCPPA